MELTKEQQDIIEKAAVDYGDKLKAEGKQASFAGVWYAAMDFALSSPDLMRGVLEEFAEWIRTFEALERQNGQWVIESQLSDKDIVKAFIEDKKQKEDVHSGE